MLGLNDIGQAQSLSPLADPECRWCTLVGLGYGVVLGGNCDRLRGAGGSRRWNAKVVLRQFRSSLAIDAHVVVDQVEVIGLTLSRQGLNREHGWPFRGSLGVKCFFDPTESRCRFDLSGIDKELHSDGGEVVTQFIGILVDGTQGLS